MHSRLALVSYSLATLAGICLISGLTIMANERGIQSVCGKTGRSIVNDRLFVRHEAQTSYCRRSPNKRLVIVWRFSVYCYVVKGRGKAT